MNDYKAENLDERLTPEDSLMNKNNEFKDSYDFQSQNDANIIGNRSLRTFNFGKGYGGTIVLGGTLNGNGEMVLRSESGGTIFTGDKDGHHYFNAGSVESIRMDLTGFHAYGTAGTSTEYIKVDNTGFHAYGTIGTATTLDEQVRVDKSGFHAYGTGGTSEELVKVDNVGLHGYLIGGTETLRVGPAGIQGFGEDGHTFTFYDYNEVEKGFMGYSEGFPGEGTNSFIFSSPQGINMYFLADYFWAAGTKSSDTACIIAAPEGTADISLVATGDVNVSATNFKVNGAPKEAVVPTSKGYKALYCTESPEVWFMDFCDDKEKIDPLFLEATEGKMKFIKCDDGTYQVWRRRKGFANKRFEQKTKEEFDKNYKFWKTPYETT